MQAASGLKIKWSYARSGCSFVCQRQPIFSANFFASSMAATGFFPGSFFSVGGGEGFVVGVVGQTLPFGVLAFYPAGL